MSKISFLIIITFFSLKGNTQDKYLKLDSFLNTTYQKQKFSGIVMVAEGNKIAYSNTFGYANQAEKTFIQKHTSFDLSSLAKLFTAVSVAILVDKGKLSFEDYISTYFPTIPKAEKMTIRQVMSHTSGLENFHTDKNFNYKNIYSCHDLIEDIEKRPLLFAPGDSVYYGTSAMILLGAIVEKVSGLNYPTFVYQYIIQPLNLKNTYFDNYYTVQNYRGLDAKYARGYIKNEDGKIREKDFYQDVNTLRVLSSGGMYSSAQDLYLFMYAVINNRGFLKQKTMRLLVEQQTKTNWTQDWYGYGLIFNIIYNGLNKEAWGHAGISSGHQSFCFYYPIYDTYLIVLSNYGFINIFELVHHEIETIIFDE